jgi:hypothetical protein
LQSLTAHDESEDLWNALGDHVPAPGSAGAEAEGTSDLPPYQFGQTEKDRPVKEDQLVSPTTRANAETNDEAEFQDAPPPEQSRKDSLLANLQSLHSRMNALGEKISSSASELTANMVLGDRPQPLNQISDTIKTASTQQGKRSDNSRLLPNLADLVQKIKSLAMSLEDPITKPQPAFYANAWLAVHQMNDLESRAMALLSDIENNSSWHGTAKSSVQTGAAFSYQISVSLPNIVKEVNPRCERLVTSLERLALQAPMPRPLSTEASVCPLCGKEKD